MATSTSTTTSTTTQPKVLFVLSSHSKMGDTGKLTGWYLPEFAHPYQVLSPHTQITIASPSGGSAPLDPASVELFKEDAPSVDFLNTQSHLWTNTEKLENFVGRAAEFDAIFYVGGHGPMWDLAHSPVSQQIITEFHSLHKIISAVCHGPAALAFVPNLLTTHSVTGFSNTEEENMGLLSVMPFKLEDALRAAVGSSGKYEKADEMYGAKVVVSDGGRLVTGQNPASAEGVGKAILEGLRGGVVGKTGEKEGKEKVSLKDKVVGKVEKILHH